MLVFSFAYLLLIGLLAGFYRYSQEHRGLNKNGQTWHYIFKYGPTAGTLHNLSNKRPSPYLISPSVLTVFAALWTQIEHRTKLLAPWHAISGGPTPAANSVLLDYLSPMNVKVLPQAIRSRHYAVAFSIVGSLLIKVLIIISTGLVASQDVAFRKQSTVETQAFTVPDNFDGGKIDSRPSLNVEGINRTGLYPFGSTLEHAFQPFAAPPGVNLCNSPSQLPDARLPCLFIS